MISSTRPIQRQAQGIGYRSYLTLASTTGRATSDLMYDRLIYGAGGLSLILTASVLVMLWHL
jgi:hypothetical protein